MKDKLRKLIFRYINKIKRPMWVDEEYTNKTTNEYMNEKIKNKEYKIPTNIIENIKKQKDGNYFLAKINPNNFLKITSNDNKIKEIENDVIKKTINLKEINKSYMYLNVDFNNGKVQSHEGRHRMQSLKNKHYTKVEIIIKSTNNEYDKRIAHDFSSLHLKHQIDGQDFQTTITNLKFLNDKK